MKIAAEDAASRSASLATLPAVLATLNRHQAELRQMGVLHAAVFGSVARGDDRVGSDVDIVIDVDTTHVRSLFALGGIQQYLEEWIGRPVDVARRDRLRRGVAEAVIRDGVVVF